jgi:hypothetical protein
MTSPRFDDSIEQIVALRVPIAACSAVALGLAVLLASSMGARVRRSWAKVPLVARLGAWPYRTTEVPVGYVTRVPLAVRAAAICCFAFGHVFVPGLVAALISFRFDGIAVPLIPGIGMALGIWACGFLLLQRSARAPEIVRSTAVASLVMNVALFVMSVLHIALVEGSYAHECSSSLAFTAGVFAGAAVVQGIVMLIAMGRWRGAFAATAAIDGRAAEACAE